MDHSTQVDGGAGSLGHHSSDAYPYGDEESEFDEGDWEEEEEQDEEYNDETQEEEEEEGEEEEESDSSSTGSLGGDDADIEEAEENEGRKEQEEDDHNSSSVLVDDVKTEPRVTAATGGNSTFAAASLSSAPSLGGRSGASAFGPLAPLEASSSPPPTTPSVFAASPLATSTLPQPFPATTKPGFPRNAALQEQRPLSTPPVSSFQSTAPAPTAATQPQVGTITDTLQFVDFERSLGQKLSSSEWHHARKKADEVQDVKRVLARYHLVLPTDKFDEQIEKALYGR
ncbi:hypothetical protein, unknown function [Leishmania tarentolae]|uniref:Uncharacterized protein n=1 Tax=Leishmania tarentolae TaxID=5689 RepID=A0A640KUD5_LEITA|nr:hypothetical protein, unknown function [Leishmania tarentolae]